jgi:hypothetical protein
VPNEGELGGPIRTLFRPIVTGENPSDDVFVDWDVESQGDLLSNSRTAPGGIAPFGLDNGFNEFSGRSLWTGLARSVQKLDLIALL